MILYHIVTRHGVSTRQLGRQGAGFLGGFAPDGPNQVTSAHPHFIRSARTFAPAGRSPETGVQTSLLPARSEKPASQPRRECQLLHSKDPPEHSAFKISKLIITGGGV